MGEGVTTDNQAGPPTDCGEGGLPLTFDQLASPPVQPVSEELDVGSQVRALRKRQGWSLTEAADRFGIGRSTLAKIESGNMSPTIGLLQKIALGFEVDLTALVSRMVSEPASGRLAITRAGEGEHHSTAEHVHEVLAGELARKKMVPFRSRIRLRKGNKSQWFRHEAEEFVYVLEGAVELQSEHYAPKVLEVGDSAYLDGRMAHRIFAVGEQDAVVLFVIST
jgi:transcriptional regulator with XRE-family HTH domain